MDFGSATEWEGIPSKMTTCLCPFTLLNDICLRVENVVVIEGDGGSSVEVPKYTASRPLNYVLNEHFITIAYLAKSKGLKVGETNQGGSPSFYFSVRRESNTTMLVSFHSDSYLENPYSPE